MEMKRGLTNERLQRILRELPPDVVLEPNEVRNLAIVDKDDRYLGYISMLTGEVDLVDAERPEDD